MNASHITVSASGAHSFVGPAAVNVFRMITLKSALSMFARCGMIPTRGVTGPVMLKMATEYTGKTYKRGQQAQAAADMVEAIEKARAAVPHHSAP